MREYIKYVFVAFTITGLAWLAFNYANENDSVVKVYPTENSRLYVPEHRSDEDTWDTSGDIIIMKGCREWQARDPNADC